MNITKETIKSTLRSIMAEESEYQTFFKKALEKAGKSIPSMSDEEKKAFFNKIDAAWNARGEKNEELKGNQHKLDVDGDGEIEASDLAALRAGEKADEEVNEEKYPIAVEKFNKELIKHPMVKKAAEFYKKTPAEIVKAIQQRLYSKGDKTGNTKEVWIDFKDTTSGITIKHKMKFNESAGCGCGCGCGGSKMNEALKADPRKVYGGTGAKEGMVLVKQAGFIKVLELSKKNPSNVFLVSDDNYTNFGPFYVKNGKVAKYTVANPNYDLEKNKVRTVKVPNDVILKFKIVESTESVNEGRAFINAAKKAKAEGKTEFEFNGKTYPVTIKESVVNEDAGMNKKVKAFLDKGLSDLTKGKPNHHFAVMNVLMGALTDANFHSEAKKVPSIFPKAKYEGDPMGKQDAIGIYEEMGENVANICKWDGKDIVDAIGFYVSMTIGRPVGEKVEKLVESVNETIYLLNNKK